MRDYRVLKTSKEVMTVKNVRRQPCHPKGLVFTSMCHGAGQSYLKFLVPHVKLRPEETIMQAW